MSEQAITLLRRIASGMKLSPDGDFVRMTRAEMIRNARIACSLTGQSFGAKPAWRGALPPRPRKPRKLRLTPRITIQKEAA